MVLLVFPYNCCDCFISCITKNKIKMITISEYFCITFVIDVMIFKKKRKVEKLFHYFFSSFNRLLLNCVWNLTVFHFLKIRKKTLFLLLGFIICVEYVDSVCLSVCRVCALSVRFCCFTAYASYNMNSITWISNIMEKNRAHFIHKEIWVTKKDK